MNPDKINRLTIQVNNIKDFESSTPSQEKTSSPNEFESFEVYSPPNSPTTKLEKGRVNNQTPTYEKIKGKVQKKDVASGSADAGLEALLIFFTLPILTICKVLAIAEFIFTNGKSTMFNDFIEENFKTTR